MRAVRRFDPAAHRIGVFCPSDGVSKFPRRTRRAIEALRRLAPTGVEVASNTMSITGEDDRALRHADFTSLLEDDSVGLIICATGGYTALELSLMLDDALLDAYTKPLIGFSDVTNLLMSIYARTGIASFHGPMALPNFGEAHASAWEWNAMMNAVSHADCPWPVEDPPAICDSFRFWDRDDDGPASCPLRPQRSTFGTGLAEGRLLGGNLDSLVSLTAAGLAPDWHDVIIFWEAAFGSVTKARRDLATLSSAGIFDAAAGMIVGLPFQVEGAQKISDMAREVAEAHGLPTIYGISLGHTWPIVTLPIGATARIDTQDASIMILESAVIS